jgi:Na+-transporting methylmalonyl-CoA/oxaloacetate decarboxylase gamma subunit
MMRRYKYSVLAGLIAAGILVSPYAANAAEVSEGVVATALSADNSLKQLTISGADLSPDFYYSTVKYTATVPYEVTEVEVTAKASNDKATIESISGYENLAVGKNTIKIVVMAENGNEATYTITLTRLAEDETTGSGASEVEPEEPDVSEEQPEDADTTQGGENGSDATEPEEEQEPVQLSYGDYGLSVVNPPEGQVPDSLVQVSLEVDGTAVDLAYQYVGDLADEGEDLSDYYFLYGTDNLGSSGWFMYDSRVGMFERFIGQFLTTGTDSGTGNDAGLDTGADTAIAEDAVSDEYAQLLANYNAVSAVQKQLEQKIRLMTAVFLFIIVILVIIMFSILWSKRNDKFEDEEVFDDEKKPIKKEKSLETIPVTRTAADTGREHHRPEPQDARGDVTDREVLQGEDEQPDAIAETKAEADESGHETPANRNSAKKKKRRDSILAYLGLDDDLPLDYGDEIEDEDEDESEAVEESTGKKDQQMDVKKDTKKDGGKDDIEFIDL